VAGFTNDEAERHPVPVMRVKAFASNMAVFYCMYKTGGDMNQLRTLAVLLIFLLTALAFPAQASADRIRITQVTVLCDVWDNELGGRYRYAAEYVAGGHRIVNESLTLSNGGGRIDAYHHVGAGADTLSNSEGLWAFYPVPSSYPFSGAIRLEMYAGTKVTYISGRNVIDGPRVAESWATFTCNQQGPTQATIVFPEDETGKPFDPGDGRVKPDAGAPVAIYCRDYGIDVYRIHPDSTGTLAFTATNAEIERVGDTPAEHTLIDSAGNIRLYRLTTGEFQVNAGPDAEGKEYVLTWAEC
jgi:hypothetical protein